MTKADPTRNWVFRSSVALSRVASAFEAFWVAAWPAVAVVGAFLVASLFGVWAWLPVWLHGLGLIGFAVALAWAVWRARGALSWPSREAALRRLERVNALPHEPLRGLGDRLSGGGADGATRSLWQRHQQRLARRLRGLRVGVPRSDLPRRDPWGLRAALLLLLIVALVEAGGMAPRRLVQAFELGGGGRSGMLPVELTLWITPPEYTGRPPVRLEARPAPAEEAGVVGAPPAVPLPVGSEALAQLHHLVERPQSYALSLDDQGEAFVAVGEDSAEATLTIDRSGHLRIGSATEGFGDWDIAAIPDEPPGIEFAEPPAATQRGVLRSHFVAKDDYGVGSVALLLSRPERPEESERIELMRPSGGTTEIDDAAYLDLTPHRWAGLPVVLRLEAIDALDQRGQSAPQEIVLPERPFNHPVARALIEQRRRLAADPETRDEVAATLDKLDRVPDLYQNDMAVFLALRSATLRLLSDDPKAIDDVLELLWETALHLEDGKLSLAERDLRKLQDALKEALARGASDAELERLMNELQRALETYLDELARQAQQAAGERPQDMAPLDPNATQVERKDFQQMLDMMREMVKTGSREAARQMLAQLQEMLENLQVAQNGQMQQGQQMMSQLQQMVQRQQDLLDETFGLSRQQNQQGFQDRPGQEGRQGQQGRRGEQGQEGEMGGMQPGSQPGQLATGQEALRRALGELMRAIGEAGAQIPRALGEAELAMRSARDALQQGQPGQALDPQAQALDQLRQGGQAMMQEMQRMLGQGQGQMPGQQFGQAPNNRDPLGRSMYNQGGADLWGERVPSQLDLGRARAVLEELYRRASQRNRPPEELDYLQRLLRRF